MKRAIKQFRYYGEGNSKNAPNGVCLNNLVSGSAFDDYMPIVQLGIQSLPGQMFRLNNGNDPIIVGISGMYEIDLCESTGRITDLAFDRATTSLITNNPDAYLIIDILYEEG